MKTGMIIVGYQGIGKSTLAKNGNGYIDLESSNFFVGGQRDANWYRVYCQIAWHLAVQGYRVFTSSHQVVRDTFAGMNTTFPKVIVFPDPKLKDKWIRRLEIRFANCNSNKNFKALKNAQDRFDENIDELRNHDGFDPISINSMDYDLHALIEAYLDGYKDGETECG